MDRKSNFKILKEMFPETNENYLQQLCKTNPDESEENLNYLVSILLNSTNDNNQVSDNQALRSIDQEDDIQVLFDNQAAGGINQRHVYQHVFNRASLSTNHGHRFQQVFNRASGGTTQLQDYQQVFNEASGSTIEQNDIQTLLGRRVADGNDELYDYQLMFNDEASGSIDQVHDYQQIFNNEAYGSATQQHNVQQQELIKNKHETLIRAFPSVDPEFLLNILKENLYDNDKLNQAIEDKILNNKYKRRSEYFKKQKTSHVPEVKKGFNVEDFLAEYPDPFTHFENQQRKCVFNDNALKFLKERFSYYQSSYIINAYILNKYNLTTTNSELAGDSIIPTINFKTDNKSINDEIQFIQNKNLIRKKLDELEILRVQNQLLTCECCYSEVKSTDCNNCENFHIFCNSCIIKGTNHAISEGSTIVKCFIDCDKEIQLSTLKAAIPIELFDAFSKKKQEAELIAAKVEGLEYCPSCQSAQILTEEDKIFKCENEECMKITCRTCKKNNHLPTKCEDVLDEHKGLLFVQEQMSDALIRRCYKCQKPFIKSTGCNHMTCVCGARMCYVCGKPESVGCRCGTYGGSDRERVEQRRREAKNKILQNNPDLDLKGV